MGETAGLHFKISADNEEIKRKLAETRQCIINSGKTAEEQGAKIEGMFKRAAAGATAFVSIAAIKQFGMDLINITGQFQTFEAVLTNTLQSPAKAKEAMNMLQNFAATTPFQVDALTGAFVKLANQGFVPTYAEMMKLGDLASSTGKDFDQLAEAIIDAQTGEFERLKEFGIRASKNGDAVTFTFKEQQTQVDFTASSIRDYVLSLGEMQGVQGANAEIAKTLTGQMSNLQDGITQMMNEIGQSSDGMLSGALSGVSALVENYEQVGKILISLIAAYSTYKAAVITTEAIHKLTNTVRLTEEAAELSKLLTVEQQAKISKLGLTKTSAEYSAVVKAEVAANIQAAQSALAKARTEVSAANQIVAARRTEYITAKQLEKQRLAELMSIGTTGTAKQVEAAQRKLAVAETQRETAAIAFQTASRDFGTKKLAVETAAKAVSTVTTAADTAAQTANVTVTGVLSIAKVKLAAIAAKLNAVIMANPYALAAVAVLALGYGIYKLVTYQTDAEKAQAKLNETVKESEKSIAAERYQIDLMFARLQAAKKGTEEYAAAKQAIMNQYGSYLKKLGDEKTALNDIAAAYKLITEEAAKAARARAMEQATKDAADTVTSVEGGAYDEIKKLLEKKYKGQKDKDGKDLSATYIMKFKPVIEGKENITQELQGIISQFDKEKVFTDPETGRQLSSLITNPLKEELSSLAKARGIYQKTMDEALMKFGESPSNTGGKTEFDITKASLQQLMEELPKATGMLQELRNAENTNPEDVMAQTTKISNIKAQITAREAELRVIKDAEYKSLEARIKALQTKLPKQGRGGENEAEKQPKDYTEQLAKEAQAKARLEIDFEHAVSQAKVNAMAEGIEKVLAQNQLDFDKEKEQIERQKAEMLTAIQNWERTIWEAQNPNWEKEGKNFTPETTQLSNQQLTGFSIQETTAFNKMQTANKAALNAMLDDYRNYEDKRKEINDKYDSDEWQIISTKLLSESEKNEALIELAKKRKSAIGAIDIEETESMNANIKGSTHLWASLFEDFAYKSKKSLKEITTNARDVLQYVNDTPTDKIEGKFGMTAEQLKALKNDTSALSEAYEKLNAAESEQIAKNPFASLIAGVKTYKKSLDNVATAKKNLETTKNNPKATGEDISRAEEAVDNAENASLKIKENLKGAAQGVAQEMTRVGASLEQAGESLGNETLANVGKAVSLIGDTASKLASGDFLGAALGLFTAWATSAGEHRKALKELEASRIAQQREYNLLLMEQNLLYEKGTTIFGNDPYGKAINSIKEYKKALSDVNTATAGTPEQQNTQRRNNTFSNLFGYKDPQADKKEQYAGLASMQVVTGHKKGFLGIGKKDLYSDILSVYPELIDANGKFDAEVAKTVISTQKMDEQTKASLQNLVDLSEKQKQALEQVKDYLTNIFGELGNTMSDALADAFTNGTDAAKAFSDSVSDMLENLAKQMVYSVTIAPLMKKAEEDMLAVMKDDTLSDEEKFKKQAGIVGSLTKEAIAQQGKANELYKIAQDAAAEGGVEIFKPDETDEPERETAKQGIATASQESVDENNGRLTAIQGHTFELSENIKIISPNITSIKDSMDFIKDNAAQQLEALYGIRNNTAPISAIESEIRTLRSDISTIILKGITIK